MSADQPSVIRFDHKKLPRIISQVIDLHAKLVIEPTQFWDILDLLPVAVLFSSDRECSVIEGNSMARVLLRAQPGENLSRSAPEKEQPPFTVYADGKPVPVHELPMQKAAATGKPVPRSECEVRFSDGSSVFLSGHSVPIFDENGEVCGSIGAFTDITHVVRLEEENRANIDTNKKKELALRESEQRFRQVTESLPQLVWTCTPEGPCDYLSPQWVHYTGANETEQLGYGWLNQLHPDDRENTVAAWRTATTKGDNFVAEFRIRGRDGVFRWFRTLAVPLRDGTGKITKWFGSNTDINDIKLAEAKLRESEERLAAAMRAGALGFYDFDLRSWHLEWNGMARSIWGYSDDEAVTYEKFLSGLHPEDRDRVHAADDASRDPLGSHHFDMEYRVINRRTREVLWVHDCSDVIFEGSTPVRMLGIVQDVTDRKRAEEHAALLLHEVNHRSKNLLTVVQSIAWRTAKAEKPDRFFETFSQRLAGLAACQDLLVKNEWKGIAIEELVQAQLAPFTGQYKDQISSAGPKVEINPAACQAIGMALHELATNAAKYGALSVAHGRIDIRWEVRDAEFGISWVERHGPPVKPSTRRGFGTKVITTLTEESLQGQVKLDFESTGVIWRLTCPAHKVINTTWVKPGQEYLVNVSG